ncbi:unnamed protein product [Staurois parvus]|uniref:Coiled-coil-helix-coiled-coil-helix domain-containing protein 1 n=1 Tax=Staurois parvus TaxID=386267 RepID=A0ABN9CQM8_9NEOB|nr:unnamed protein product [Staurois parvus]
MAAEGVIMQAKVARLLSRRFGKPILVPKKPLELTDRVSNRKAKIAEASCLSEMAVLMACWKENTFSDKICSNEINIFYKCVAQAQADRNAGSHEEVPAGLLPADKVNKLLKKYPNRKHEI